MSALTGRIRYRTGWFGRIIVQVEYATREPHAGTEGRCTDWLWTGRKWRDARCQDMFDALYARLSTPADHPLHPAWPAKETL